MCFGLGDLEIVENPGLPARPGLKRHTGSLTRVSFERRKTYPRAYDTLVVDPPHKRASDRAQQARDSNDAAPEAAAQPDLNGAAEPAPVPDMTYTPLPDSGPNGLFGEVKTDRPHTRDNARRPGLPSTGNVIITINPTRYERKIVHDRDGNSIVFDTEAPMTDMLLDASPNRRPRRNTPAPSKRGRNDVPRPQPWIYPPENSRSRSKQLFGSLNMPSPSLDFPDSIDDQDVRKRSHATSVHSTASSSQPRPGRATKHSVVLENGRRKRSFYYYD